MNRPHFINHPEAFRLFLDQVFLEDLAEFGDPSSAWIFGKESMAEAIVVAKSPGIASGFKYLTHIMNHLPGLPVEVSLRVADGDSFREGDVLARCFGPTANLLTAERTALNLIQRMCGIATITRSLVQSIAHTQCTLLDTRKTTPLLRAFEKEAVRDGGGANHRFGLYDMIMLKDNHIDFAGGISKALAAIRHQMEKSGKKLPVEVETRNLNQVEEVLAETGVARVMFDNFSPEEVSEAVALVGNRLETEASGGIHSGNLVDYAETGVQFISMGMLTHSVKSIDLSMKAELKR